MYICILSRMLVNGMITAFIYALTKRVGSCGCVSMLYGLVCVKNFKSSSCLCFRFYK